MADERGWSEPAAPITVLGEVAVLASGREKGKGLRLAGAWQADPDQRNRLASVSRQRTAATDNVAQTQVNIEG